MKPFKLIWLGITIVYAFGRDVVDIYRFYKTIYWFRNVYKELNKR